MRGQEGRALHTVSEIAASYDAQAAESYATKIENADFFERYGRAVGRELFNLSPSHVLDAGCGDGVTLHWALEEVNPLTVDAIDVSKKRVEIANAGTVGRIIAFRYGSIDCLPYHDGQFDVVFTSHAMEPNGGREAGILYELKRVSLDYVVLFEPDYDAASKEGKARMRRLNYVTNIRSAIKQVGFAVEKDEPFAVIGNELNPTNCWVLRR